MSIISMLSSPNDESPANIDAAVSSQLNYPYIDVWIVDLLFSTLLLQREPHTYNFYFEGALMCTWL